MNDPIDQLETELRQLRPAPLPATTQRRLDKITVRPPWHLVLWPVWGTALAAATATVIVTLLDESRQPRTMRRERRSSPKSRSKRIVLHLCCAF